LPSLHSSEFEKGTDNAYPNAAGVFAQLAIEYRLRRERTVKCTLNLGVTSSGVDCWLLEDV